VALPALIGLNKTELQAAMKDIGEPAFRADQLHSWLYVKAVRSFEDMSNMSKPLRQKLAAHYQVGQLTLVEKQKSNDGTCKYLFSLPDGEQIESVLMYFDKRDAYSICISTQVGCAVNCHFCATGKLGFKRQLSAAEIVEQLLFVRSDSGIEVKNLVFMGQGEPLLNYQEVLKSIHLLNQSAEIGMRHMTLSTSGIIPQIKRLAEENLQLTLAVSLHAADNETRERFMPINKKYPLEELLPVLHDYVNKTGRRLTIEYILLAGVNDTQQQAEKLAILLKNLHCNINLIPYNPIGEEYGFKRPSRDAIFSFKRWLEARAHQKVTVRIERGVDIAAACGQLKNNYNQALTTG
jgi:23S rRNA (adenine2503-C2)-methyltransferase